jgi:Uma2 family endonuclease
MATARPSNRASVDNLYNTPGKAELVDGELVLMPPTGRIPGFAALEIVVSLREYVKRTGHGGAVGDNVGFLVELPQRKSFSPDAAYCLQDQITMKFLQGAPAFSAEVRSEHDHGPAAELAMALKRADYFAAGTLVVWDVDLMSEDVVNVYRADCPDTPLVYRRGDSSAEAEPAVPGWYMPVDDLFMS